MKKPFVIGPLWTGAAGLGPIMYGAQQASLEGPIRFLGGFAESGSLTIQGSINGNTTYTASGGSPTQTVSLVAANIEIKGNVSTSVVVDGNVPSGRSITFTGLGAQVGGLETDGVLKIGGSLAGNVVLPAGGLRGQVIVNAANGVGTWTGSVSIGTGTGSATITGPTDGVYSELSSSLGGGAIGLAPFHIYPNDCDPPLLAADSAMPATSSPRTVVTSDFEAVDDNDAVPVKIRFYGPVTADDFNDGMAVLISATGIINAPDPCDSSVMWMAGLEAGFVVRGPYDPLVADYSGRTIGLSRASGMKIRAGLYRVTFPGVKSDGLIGSPAPTPLVRLARYCPDDSGSKAYYFRVGPDCDEDGLDDSNPSIDSSVTASCPTGCADFNGVNGISVQDIFDFLAAWFGNLSTADFNDNGHITVQDIFDFLAAWFAGTNCP